MKKYITATAVLVIALSFASAGVSGNYLDPLYTGPDFSESQTFNFDFDSNNNGTYQLYYEYGKEAYPFTVTITKCTNKGSVDRLKAYISRKLDEIDPDEVADSTEFSKFADTIEDYCRLNGWFVLRTSEEYREHFDIRM